MSDSPHPPAPTPLAHVNGLLKVITIPADCAILDS